MPGAARPPERSPRAQLAVPGALAVLDVPAVRRWALLTRSVFAARRVEIDALNVFPVPDGDTGTNLFLTFDGGVERMLAHDPHGAGDLLAAFAKALLWTARGNSGVILSQLARGLAEACAGADVVDGSLLARGLVLAEQRGRQAVTDPQEGTILTVASAMAAAAVEAAGVGSRPDPSLYAVSLAALEAARVALEHTPEQLEVLARAGVVDAGGAGLVLLLECLERICSGQRGRPRSDDPVAPPSTVPARAPRARADRGPRRHARRPRPGGSGRAYEVMYLLADSDEEAVDLLRSRLVALGDSVLVVGGDGEWNIHAHVDDAGAAVEAGIVAGRPHRVRITRLDRDVVHVGHAPEGASPTHPATRHTGSAIVACAAGDGLAALFGEAGAAVVPSGPGRRASTGALIDAIRAQHATGAAGVVVLPNDGDTLLAAAALRGRSPTTASTRRSCTPAPRSRVSRPSPSSTPRRRRGQRARHAVGAVGDPARRRHRREPGGPDQRRAVRPGRRARRRRRRHRRHRPRRRRGGARGRSPAPRRAGASSSPSSSVPSP